MDLNSLTAQSLDTDGRKRELFRLAATSNRGFGVGTRLKETLLELVTGLESSFRGRSPIGQLERQKAMEGSWGVIFTTSQDLEALDRLPLPGWRTARIGQVFRPRGRAENEIVFTDPFGTRVLQTVAASWELVTPKAEALRVALTFRGSNTRLQRAFGLELPSFLPSTLGFPLPPASGVFEVTYLDSEVMVQRLRAGAPGAATTSPKSTLNVLIREGAPPPIPLDEEPEILE